jgi:hypothetical protein
MKPSAVGQDGVLSGGGPEPSFGGKLLLLAVAFYGEGLCVPYRFIKAETDKPAKQLGGLSASKAEERSISALSIRP